MKQIIIRALVYNAYWGFRLFTFDLIFEIEMAIDDACE